MKKLLSLFIALAMLAGCMPAFAEGEAWEMWDGMLKVKNDVELTGEVIVPEEVDGETVIGLGSFAFSDQDEVTSIILPDTIQVIDDVALYYLESLAELKLSENLTVIAESSLEGLELLTELTIPASVKYIGDTLCAMDSLQTLTFEGVCPVVAAYDFLFDLNSDCVIYVPDDQVDAYKAALTNGYGTEEQVRPSGKNAVTYEITASEEEFDFDAATGTITGYTGTDAALRIPAAIGGVPVKGISEGAFENSGTIFYLEIPEGVEFVADNAFRDCGNMLFVSFPSSVKRIGDFAFSGCALEAVYWSEGLEEIGEGAFEYPCMDWIALPNSVRVIGDGAFGYGYLTQLYLGDQVEKIGSCAFGSNYIEYMELDFDHMVDIAPDAFEYNTDEAYICIAWDSTMENYEAYSRLFAEIFPGSTVEISNPTSCAELNLEYPFDGTDDYADGVWLSYDGSQPNLITWYSWDDVVICELGEGLFKGNRTIKSWYPHHSFAFTTIGSEAFADSSVEFVELFHGITTIGDAAFRNCTNIKEITIPATVTSISMDAFEGCTGLEKITVLCDPSVLTEGMLDSCTALTEINAGPDATEEENRLVLFALRGMPEIHITQQPMDVTALEGETASVTVQAAGENLTYVWYVMPGDGEAFAVAEGFDTNVYSVQMDETTDLSRVYCEITDAYGTVATTDEACIFMEKVQTPVQEPDDLAASPVVGMWNDGEGTIFAVNADGTCIANDGYCDNNMEWGVVDGVPTITEGLWSGAPLVLTDEGGLYVCDGWVIDAVFMPGAGEAVTADPFEGIAAVAGTAEDFAGVWHASTMGMEGMTMDAAEMGMVMDLTIGADGTITIFDGESAEEGIWTLIDGKMDIMGEMQLALIEDGRLCMAEDGAAMYFVCGDGSAAQIPAAAPIEVVPVAGEMEDFAGLWNGVSMMENGQTYVLADFGITMEITLGEDGVITLYDGETVQTGAWQMVDGKADIDGMILTLMSDGTLIGDDGTGSTVMFTGFAGTWKAVYIAAGGMNCDPRDIGLECTLILNADGTGSIDFPELEESVWYREEGITRFGENGMPMKLLSGGFLKYGSDMGGYLMFSQDEKAVWDITAAPAPTEAPKTEIPASGEAGDLQSRMGRKYIAKSYTAYGTTMDASGLGSEYSLVFREDGTCDFTMAGMEFNNLTWGLKKVAIGLTEVDAFVINYYVMSFNAVLTNAGFDMDYYGTMTLHFVPAE